SQYSAFANVVQEQQNLYVIGGAPDTFHYKNYSVNNPFPLCLIAFVIKVDTNGNLLQVRNFFGSTGVNVLSELIKIGNDKIAASGHFAGKVVVDGDTTVSYPGEGTNPRIVVLDTSGNLLKLEQIHGDGFY